MIYSDKEFIGKTIQNIRKRANLKQNALAEKIGICEKHLSKIETGKNLPSLDNFLKMAEVLHFSLEDFGIKSNNFQNPIKQELIKLIYSASDYEAESYLELINTLKKIISKNK